MPYKIEFVMKRNRQTVESIEVAGIKTCERIVAEIVKNCRLEPWKPGGGPARSRSNEIARYGRIDADYWLIVSKDERLPEDRAMKTASRCFTLQS